MLSLLETSLDYSSTQQTAISSNISNVNTPGYERKDASFAAVLNQAAQGDNAPSGILGSTDASASPNGGEISLVTDTSGAMRADGNNVDVDTEMSKLAKNQIYYQAVSEFMGDQLSNLKYVISGG